MAASKHFHPIKLAWSLLPAVPLLAFAGSLGGAPPAAAQGTSGKTSNEGIFRDRNGTSHTWRIQRSHAMVWDDKPYLPAGVVFHSAYLADPTAESLAKDNAELDRLKAAGIQDLWIDTPRGILDRTLEQSQAVIDAVESRGFRYGLRAGDRFQEPLVGFSPGSASIRVKAAMLRPGTRPVWQVRAPRGRKAVYALVDEGLDGRISNWAMAVGETVVEEDQARIEIPLPAQSRLIGRSDGRLLVATEVQVEPGNLGSYGDLWDGMEEAAHKLRVRLTSLKYGSGLRFILDPFSAGDGTVGQEDGVFPSSEGFRKAFQTWLSRRRGMNALNVAWRLGDKKLLTFEEAARLIPLWARNDAPDGDGWLMDPVDRTAYRCKPSECAIWTDLDAFRADTLKRWMNRVGIGLKQEGLNVPVLYSWAAYHPNFSNIGTTSGYDGLGAQLYGAPATLGRSSAAYALAQSEESERNTWLLATRLSGPTGADGKPAPIPDAQARGLWQSAREAGFRGAFIDPVQNPNAVSVARDLASTLVADTAAVTDVPRVCFFPVALAASDRVTRLSNGVWWVPVGGPSKILRYGESILAYEMPRPLGDGAPIAQATVMWSTTGKQDVTFFNQAGVDVALFDSLGNPVKGKIRKGELRLTLTEEPIIATGVDGNTLFPLEVVIAQLAEFDHLIRASEALGAEVKALRSLHDQGQDSLTPNSAPALYASLQPHVTRLRDRLRPYIWIEGEKPVAQNLGSIAFQPNCSGGLYLKLDRQQPPASGVYRVRYTVDVKIEAIYDLWVAGKAPGTPGASPMVWQVDDEPPAEVSSATTTAGPEYAPGISWFQLGRVTLRPGRHEVSLIFPEKAPGDSGRYSFAIDALVLSREPFRPTGAAKPPVRIAVAATTKDDEKIGKNGKRKKSDDKDKKDERDEKREKPE